MTTGTLYGVGTGPGDPQLVTRRAWSLVESAQVIAYPAPDSGESFARSIVAEAISPDAVEIPMVVPMRTGRAPAQSIYDKGAGDIAAHLAAAQSHPLVARSDILTVLPATLDDAALTDAIGRAEAVAIMKIGRHMPRLRALLGALGLAEQAHYTSHASLPHQRALALGDAPDDAPYFSMILVYKGDDPWIS